MKPIRLELIDGAILVVYFAFVLGIGFVLKRHMRTSTDFFLSGRLIPTWVAGLAFLSANLGAQEVIGMAASGAKYGIMTSHFYWVGAIPAMVFVAVFMMPFYYGSKARSVPEYLKLRFDEKTRALNAMTFAGMTVFSSGISMYAMALLLNLHSRLGFQRQRLALRHHRAALHLVRRIDLRDLQRSDAVLSHRAGFAPLVFLGLRDVGGWSGLQTRLGEVATAQHFAPGAFSHSWKFMGNAADNPMGVEWLAMLMGLGFVLSFGYWCTDFLVMQRAMAAKSMAAARRTPLVAAVPKMLFPFLVILPGMIAIALTQHHGASGFALPDKAGWLAQLRSRYPADAAPLFSVGNSRARPDRVDGVVHVRHGGQRDRVQHRLDLRHLSGYLRPKASDSALLVDGARGHRGRHRRSAWPRLISPRTSTTSWICSSWCSLS